MADDVSTVRRINWREAFPFTHLFRSFRIAIHPSKLVLGLLALLGLYVGGRILDELWRPRSLAVVNYDNGANEVYLYEGMAARGGSSALFDEARWRERERIEANYAATLVDLGVVKDRATGDQAAAKADYLRGVAEKLKERRTNQVKTAEDAKDAAYNAAKSASTNDEKRRLEREADEAYRESVRRAFANAYDDWRTAKLVRGVGLFHAFFQYETVQIVRVVHGVIRGNWLGGWWNDAPPGVLVSVYNFFAVGPVWLMRYHQLYFILFTLLFLTVWAVFGGAIARIAAVHVARDEKLSVRAALSFSVGKFLSFVSAPLIPLIIVLVVGLVPLVAGFLASLPFVGPVINIIMAALFILILACGFVMTLVLLGTFGGFNLMYPTIAVEGSDSFDAISRSFSYVYARPWRMIFYTLVAMIYGALCYLFVRMFIGLMLVLTHHFVGQGMFKQAPSLEPLWNTMWQSPATTGTLSYEIDHLTLRGDQDLAAFLIAFWVYTVVGVLGAFVISFYFSANTIIYYLMRNEVDATEMDDVYLEQADEEFSDATPVTAAPATTAVVAETVIVETTTPPAGSENPEVGRASDTPNEPPAGA